MKHTTPKIIKTDILIIGTGIAGLSTAINLENTKFNVTLVSKNKLFHNNASFNKFSYGWGMTAINPKKSEKIQLLYSSIIENSKGHINPDLVKTLLNSSYSAYMFLKKLNINFMTNNNSTLKYVKGCFSPIKNAILAHDINDTIKKLKYKINNIHNLKILEYIRVVDFIKYNHHVEAVIGYNIKTEKWYIIKCNYLILTGGGGTGIFKYSYNPDNIGELLVTGKKHGIPLLNMEYIQFTPIIIKPKLSIFSERLFKYIRRTHSVISTDTTLYLKSSGEWRNLIHKRSKHGPFNIDYDTSKIDIHIYKRFMNNNPITINISQFTNITDPVLKKYLDWLKTKINTNNISIGLVPQAFNGGFKININGKTNIKNVFAVGETTTGMHSSFRIGGNMITNCIVFSKMATDYIKNNYSKYDSTNNSDLINSFVNTYTFFHSLPDINYKNLFKNIRNYNWKYYNIIRNEKILKQYKKTLNNIYEKYPDHKTSIYNKINGYFYIELSKIICKQMLKNLNSNGYHYIISSE